MMQILIYWQYIIIPSTAWFNGFVWAYYGLYGKLYAAFQNNGLYGLFYLSFWMDERKYINVVFFTWKTGLLYNASTVLW